MMILVLKINNMLNYANLNSNLDQGHYHSMNFLSKVLFRWYLHVWRSGLDVWYQVFLIKIKCIPLLK